MKWYFPVQPASMVEAEVTQRDQFSNETLDISETIVREAIQNSLDAMREDSVQATVTFKLLDSSNGLRPEYFQQLLGGQLEHAGRELGLTGVSINEPTALVIEDFGTKGLTGSINESDEGNFSDFWRRHGKSHKTGTSRGRWGLGKLVYSLSSEASAFFGVTVREGCQSEMPLFMGQTVLNYRKVDGVTYPPHGFYCELLNEGLNQTELPIPSSNLDEVATFCSEFELQRHGNPGLSIVIPFPNKSFSVNGMIRFAIESYFYPLLTGQLLLSFNELTINASNVRELAKQYASEKLKDIDQLFDFLEGAHDAIKSKQNIVTLRASWINDNKIDEDDFDPEVFAELMSNFSEGQAISIKLPLEIRLKSGELKETYFHLFLQKPEEIAKGLDLYVRGGLTLPQEAKFGERRALGVLIAEHDIICGFLGDAENAAHTKWTANTEKLRKAYRSPQVSVRAIKNALKQLYDLFANVEDEVDTSALQEFFWDQEANEAPSKGRKRKKKLKVTEVPPLPEFIPKPRLFEVEALNDGFHVGTVKAMKKDALPLKGKLEVAYDMSNGDPFKKYDPLDFELGKKGIKVTVSNGEASLTGNVVRFEVLDLPFKLRLIGFDPNRDVKVKVNKES